MLTLGVIQEGRTLRRVALTSARLWIGRGASCDLTIDDAAGDERIACVRPWMGEYVLVAGETGRKVIVGGVPLTKASARMIRPGDVISIDGVLLEVDAVAGEKPLATPQPASDWKPMSTRGLAMRLVKQLSPRNLPDITTVRVAEGPNLGVELQLEEEGQEYIVGRGEGCALLLDDETVSRKQLRVVRQGYRVFVTDVGSSMGSRMGERRLGAGESTPWPHETMISMGETVLALDRSSAQWMAEYLEQRIGMPLEQATALVGDPPAAKKNKTGQTGKTDNKGANANVTKVVSPVDEEKTLRDAAMQTTSPSRRAQGPDSPADAVSSRSREPGERPKWRVGIVPIAIAVILALSFGAWLWLLSIPDPP